MYMYIHIYIYMHSLRGFSLGVLRRRYVIRPDWFPQPSPPWFTQIPKLPIVPQILKYSIVRLSNCRFPNFRCSNFRNLISAFSSVRVSNSPKIELSNYGFQMFQLPSFDVRLFHLPNFHFFLVLRRSKF